MYEFLSSINAGSKHNYSMVGYKLCNTLSEAGAVTRGVCMLDGASNIIEINERKKIQCVNNEYGFFDGEIFNVLEPNSDVSMNIWGFTPCVFPILEKQFAKFLEKNLHTNEEYPIPVALDDSIKSGAIKIKLLPCNSNWFGFTYKEDKQTVQGAISYLTAQGVYPTPLWG